MGNVLPRNNLRHRQSPQRFHLGTLRTAYQNVLLDPDFTTTDDCGVVLKYVPGTSVYLVKGDIRNIKLTYVEDLALLEKYLIESLV